MTALRVGHIDLGFHDASALEVSAARIDALQARQDLTRVGYEVPVAEERLRLLMGLGASPVPLPRPVTFMHDEARNVLPKLFDAIGLQRGEKNRHDLVEHDAGMVVRVESSGAFTADPDA